MTTADAYRRSDGEIFRLGSEADQAITRYGTSITGPVILENADAVTTGFNLGQFPLTRNQRHWRQWYDANYVHLWPSPTMSNGLAQLNELNALLNMPLFRMASNFLADAALSDLPSISGATEEQEQWFAENTPAIERALQRGTREWSVFNLAVYAVERGIVRAINPIHYYRVGLPEIRDADAGHILMFPYNDRSLAQQQQNQDTIIDNRIQVVYVPPNGGAVTSQDYYLSGDVIGQPVTARAPSTIVAVHTAGEGDSWYGGARDTAAALMIAVGMLIIELNEWANRERYLPSIAADAIAVAVAGEGQSSATQPGRTAIRRELTETLRPLITIPEDGMPPGDSREPLNLEDRFRQVETLADAFFMQSRLTPSSYGIGIGRGESGVAREKAQDAAGIAIRRYRRQLAGILGPICSVMGMPGGGDMDGGAQFSWAIPPFQSREAREEQVRADWESGLITRNEARSEMGRGIVDDGDVFKTDTAMDGGDAFDNEGAQSNTNDAPAE